MAEGATDHRASSSTPAVFISYASLDSAIAETVCEALEKAGVTCWIAPRDVTPGAFYPDEIVHAIDATKVLVLILSQNAAASHHVLREVERAASKRHAVISLRIDTAPVPAGLEYFLNTSQWLDARAGEIARALPKLVSAVQVAIHAHGVTPIGTSLAHVPLPVVSAWPPRRIARVAALVIGLGLVALVAGRLWLFRHQAIAPAASEPAHTPSAPPIPERSVAVLPFVDMSEKHDQEYFSDGLSEELIDLLTKVPDLRVPARTSSFFFKGKPEDIQSIAQKLRVAHVLEGSVRKAANTIRVTAQLIQADNGYHVWSETYDRNLKDVFKVQDEIAGAVVSALKVKLAPGRQAPNSHQTGNPEAHDQFLLARESFERGNLDAFRRAAAAYSRAIELDPGYAAAYAELSMAKFYSNESNNTTERQQALAAADKAVELAPDEADGYAARGYLRLRINWDWNGAHSDFEKAVALDSGNRVQARYSELLAALGRRSEAIAAAKKATELDPLSTYAWSDLGLWLLENGEFPAAHNALARALEIAPQSAYPLSWLGELQLLEDRASEALGTFHQVDDEVPSVGHGHGRT